MGRVGSNEDGLGTRLGVSRRRCGFRGRRARGILECMNVLLTNDDGIDAPGLRSLVESFRRIGRVTVIAPVRGASAASHAITLHRPLVVKRESRDRIPHFSVLGHPADCVKLALHGLAGSRPHLVVSGINHGLNVGHDILYSGTVAAAMEASAYGIPSFAISLQASPDMRFSAVAMRSVRIIRRLMDGMQTEGTVFNINFPSRVPLGVRVCPPDNEPYRDRYVCRKDGDGRFFFWLRPAPKLLAGTNGRLSDVSAIAKGYIAVTPLRRNVAALDRLEEASRALAAFR